MNNNKIENLDELLRINWMQDSIQSVNDEKIFSEKTTFNMNDAKRHELIDKLYSYTLQPSFGELLSKSLEGKTETEVLEKTQLSEAMLGELKEDKVAVNNIPVFLLKNLLTELRISFVNAQTAILKTFEIIQGKIAAPGSQPALRPAFRKGVSDESSETVKRVPNKNLFENEESLNKYLKSLEKLMQ